MKLLQAGDRIWIKKGYLLSGGYGPGTVVVSQLRPDDVVLFVRDGMDPDGPPGGCVRSECIRMRKERRLAPQALAEIGPG